MINMSDQWARKTRAYLVLASGEKTREKKSFRYVPTQI